MNDRITINTDKIHEALLKKFPDAEIGNHESDLHVLSTPSIFWFIANTYKHTCDLNVFNSEIDGKQWIEIPFAYNKELDK